MYSIIKYSSPVDPNELMLHALFSSVTQNKLKDVKADMYRQPHYKIWDDGRDIFIVIDENNTDLFADVVCQDFTFMHQGKEVVLKFEGKQPFEVSPIEMEERVHLIGTLNYARKVGQKHVCPAGKDGFISLEAENNFKTYFLNQTGIWLEDVQVMSIPVHDLPISQSVSNNHTVMLHNAFGLSGVGVVKDAKKAFLIEVSSIGKKRSYGFGNLFIQDTFK